MSLFVTIIIFLVILLVLVLVHELGHFLIAKLFGIRVDEFAFGFPPRLFSIKIGETEYSFNLFPIGGYVKIFGEDPTEAPDETKEDQTRKFSKKPFYIQAAVIVAGVVMNFILAWILLSAVFMIGSPTAAGSVPEGATLKNPKLTAIEIVPDSPADRAGILAGDAITMVSADGQTISTPSEDQFSDFIARHGSEPVQVSYQRGEEKFTKTIVPTTGVVPSVGNRPIIGVSLVTVGTYTLPPLQAFASGFTRAGELMKTEASALGVFVGQAVSGHANFNEVAGPVGIVSLVGDVTTLGLSYVLSFVAIISLNLAIVNIIPFPALDGGRLLFIIIETIKGSPIKPKIANMTNAFGFALLLILMAVVTYHDILRLFH